MTLSAASVRAPAAAPVHAEAPVHAAAPVHAPPALEGWPREIAAAWRASFRHAATLDPAARLAAAQALRTRLHPSALGGPDGARALGLVAGTLQAVLGWSAYEQQGLAAWLMLQGRLVEMATGEGKTLAAALAAATAALAGRSVHVLTANDYLVQRDQAQMAPVFQALGLGSAAVVTATSREARQAAYRQPIVYVTGRELVFDHLKDHLALAGERDPRVLRARALAADGDTVQPLVPALQQAILDEADSILLDEASIPFILSAPGAAPDLAALEAARVLARSLQPDTDYRLLPGQRQAELTDAGRARVARVVPRSSPLWPARHAVELVRAALVAQHLLRRDRDYAVIEPQGVQLIDETTGRIAHGRQWNHPLHAMVELEEGRAPTAPLQTAARITYQRFFPRYERLGGMSGTLRESAAELQALYGCPVVRVPRVRPPQARWLGRAVYVDDASRWQRCVHRVQAMVAQGRPVLLGTDSVGASRALSAALAAAGLPHEVLNAVQDAREAQQIARAGERGRVTVTTNMAGRGTDIRLDDAARAAGGLHVILALSNRSRRSDRQLAGRAARHGDPGSAEALMSLDDAPLAWALPRAWRRWLARCARADGRLPAVFAPLLAAWAQRRLEWQERLRRRDLRLIDDEAEGYFGFAGRAE